MRYLRISLISILLGLCQFGLNAQVGNYVIRDSTTNLPTKNYNTIIGTKTAPNLNNTDAVDNTFIGSYTGYNVGSNGVCCSPYSGLTFIGSKAGYNQSISGGYNQNYHPMSNATFIGAYAGYNPPSLSINIQGRGGTLIGYKAGYNGANYSSIAIGVEAGFNGVGAGAVLIGGSAGALRPGSQHINNVFIGEQAGYNFSGNYSTVIGGGAGSGSDTQFSGGEESVFIGASAGKFSNANTSTFVGASAGKNTQSYGNTYIGNSSGVNNTSTISSGNTALGYFSGASITVGRNNTYLGFEADGISPSNGGLLYNSVAIGYKAKVSESNSFILGGTGAESVNVGIGNTAPQNKLEITSATTNTSGLRFTNLKSTSTPSTANSLALSVDANGDVILVPAATGGLTNPVTNLQVLSGTAGVSGLRLNNLPLSTTAAAANGKTLSVDATGNVILVTAPAGFTNPVTNLQVQSGTAGVSGLTLNNVNSASATTTANGKVLSVDATGNVILVPVTTPVIPAGADVWDQLTNGADYLIRNKNNKSVMIGTVAATKTSIDYKLYVEKGILAEKVKVSANANWPDYVFGKDYSLMPLKEVENYITTNNHLPEVPSAEVIAKDGLDLGKMDATLLKKVEELTLYLIEQNKKIEVLQNELNTLKAKK